jgi:hypothetical protein
MIQYILGTFGVGAVNRWIGGQTAFTSYSCRGLGQSRPASDSIQYHNGFLLVRPLIKNSFFYPTSQDRLTLSVGLNPLPFAMRWIPISWHSYQLTLLYSLEKPVLLNKRNSQGDINHMGHNPLFRLTLLENQERMIHSNWSEKREPPKAYEVADELSNLSIRYFYLRLPLD